MKISYAFSFFWKGFVICLRYFYYYLLFFLFSFGMCRGRESCLTNYLVEWVGQLNCLYVHEFRLPKPSLLSNLPFAIWKFSNRCIASLCLIYPPVKHCVSCNQSITNPPFVLEFEGFLFFSFYFCNMNWFFFTFMFSNVKDYF